MKSAAYILLLALAIGVSGCGSSSKSKTSTNSTTGATNTSGLTNRAFVANTLQTITGVGGGIQILDAQNDLYTTFTIQGISGIAPQSITLIPGVLCHNDIIDNSDAVCGLGATFSTSNNTLYLFDPTYESNLGDVALPGLIGNFVISPDTRFAYAAVPQLGEVVTADISGYSLLPTINVGGAHYVSLSPDGTSLMIESDHTNTITVMNTATKATYTISDPNSVIDHPLASFFLDATDAAVLSCGAECGGTQANIALVSLTQQAVVGHTNIDGGTAGLLVDDTLFVTGNCVAAPCNNPDNLPEGELIRINLTPTSATVAGVTPITGGYHQMITQVQNSELFLGSVGEPGPGQCANPVPASPPADYYNPGGCLSIVNLVTNQVVTDTPRGDATGAAGIPGRTVVYVTEGGRLLIYDTTTMVLYTTTPDIPITGFLVDVQSAGASAPH